MAAKEILCVICIGMGGPQAPVDSICDFAKKVIEGPNAQDFRPSRNDSRGSLNLQATILERHKRCLQEQERK